jgi:hypothetical protein
MKFTIKNGSNRRLSELPNLTIFKRILTNELCILTRRENLRIHFNYLTSEENRKGMADSWGDGSQIIEGVDIEIYGQLEVTL